MKTEACACPKCGKKLDRISSMLGHRQAESGDLSVCIGCGAILIYQPDTKPIYRNATPEYLHNFPEEEREALFFLQRLVRSR